MVTSWSSLHDTKRFASCSCTVPANGESLKLRDFPNDQKEMLKCYATKKSYKFAVNKSITKSLVVA
jgi:hypothetical protein